MGMQVYKVRGEWVDEPFVTFGQAEMVLYADAQERERVLREALEWLQQRKDLKPIHHTKIDAALAQ